MGEENRDDIEDDDGCGFLVVGIILDGEEDVEGIFFILNNKSTYLLITKYFYLYHNKMGITSMCLICCHVNQF
jgi:hypothetical protein